MGWWIGGVIVTRTSVCPTFLSHPPFVSCHLQKKKDKERESSGGGAEEAMEVSSPEKKEVGEWQRRFYAFGVLVGTIHRWSIRSHTAIRVFPDSQKSKKEKRKREEEAEAEAAEEAPGTAEKKKKKVRDCVCGCGSVSA